MGPSSNLGKLTLEQAFDAGIFESILWYDLARPGREEFQLLPKQQTEVDSGFPDLLSEQLKKSGTGRPVTDRRAQETARPQREHRRLDDRQFSLGRGGTRRPGADVRLFVVVDDETVQLCVAADGPEIGAGDHGDLFKPPESSTGDHNYGLYRGRAL